MTKIELKGIEFAYKDAGGGFYQALDHVDCAVDEGEFVSIIGSSGCGKSTILNVIAGLNRPTSGSFTIDGQDTSGPGKNRAVVFQHYSLFPWMTIKKNVMFAVNQTFPQKSKSELSGIAMDFLKSVGLSGYENKFPSQLSGGMQQRAAIARALAMGTDILLMDEPFGAIDAKNRVILQDLLLDILQDSGNKKTVVFVTHDVDEAILLSDRILFVKDRHIAEEIHVDFRRPRIREEIFGTQEYIELRKRIVSMFYYEDKTLEQDIPEEEEEDIA